MTRPANMVSMAFVLLALASCSQEVPQPRHAPAVDAFSQERQAVAVAFEVRPDSFRTCEADHGAISVAVKWVVEDGSPSGVAIYVVDSKGNRKLWLEGGASGQSSTGRWVFPDTRFVLIERAGGRQLADAVVRGLPCEAAGKSPAASISDSTRSVTIASQGQDH